MRRHGLGNGWGQYGLLAGLVLLAGCHHRKPQPVLLPAQTPVPLELPPGEVKPALVEPTKPKLPPVPVAAGAEQPKKTRRRSRSKEKEAVPAAATTAPAAAAAKAPETASDAPAPASLGSLSVGGDQSPRVRQEAIELLAANERRLNGLSADLQKQAALVSKARQFQKDAQQALNSGDAAGAKTLATKGKLLLDDLEAGSTTK